MSYAIEIKRSAIKDIQKLPKAIAKIILQSIQSLKEDPFTGNATKLKSKEKLYRLRVGNYRIVYTVEKQIDVVTVVKIGHRKDIYKKL